MTPSEHSTLDGLVRDHAAERADPVLAPRRLFHPVKCEADAIAGVQQQQWTQSELREMRQQHEQGVAAHEDRSTVGSSYLLQYGV